MVWAFGVAGVAGKVGVDEFGPLSHGLLEKMSAKYENEVHR